MKNVRELNNGGPPKLYSTHRKEITELKFDNHSPTRAFTQISHKLKTQCVSLSKIVMPNFNILE